MPQRVVRTILFGVAALIGLEVASAGEGREIPQLAAVIAERIDVPKMMRYRARGGNQPALISHIFEYVVGCYPQQNAAALWRRETQETYILLHQKHQGQGPRAAKQSWAASSGRAFEQHVRESIDCRFRNEGILARSASQLDLLDRGLRQKLTLRIKRPCADAPAPVWPDNDVIVVAKTPAGYTPFAIISCKTSLHARLTESMFWAIVTRQQVPVKSLFVTLDLDLELGDCKRPTRQDRVLGETFFDRMYSLNEETTKCPRLRPYGEVFDDLRGWRDEMVGQARGEKEEQ